MMFDVGDAVFYTFSGRRSTFSQLTLALNDWRQILPTSFQYPIFWTLLLILWAGVFFASRMYVNSFRKLRSIPARPRFFALASFAAVIFLCARGGTQIKPIAPTHAYIFSQPQLGDLALSTAFAITRTTGENSLTSPAFFSSWDEVTGHLPKVEVAPAISTPGQLNFMLIIWESLSAEYTGTAANKASYTPFLDSLLNRSMWFPNSFANGRRSIESSTSLLFGIPALMNEALIQSPYAGGLVGLPGFLKKGGYSSAFFHGGARGSMFFDVMAKIAGFDRHFGKEDFPDLSQDDGNWGIFDGPFFRWTVGEIGKLPPPFFATLFTLSSHSPYSIPKDWQGRLPKGPLPIHESIAYTDAMLKEFFESAARQPWFKNTIFIITGDHTSLTTLVDFSEVQPFRVPIVIFSPGGQIPAGKRLRVVQHADVLPTIMSLAELPMESVPRFGQSMLLSQGGGQAVNRFGDAYWLLRPQRLAILEPNKATTISEAPGEFDQTSHSKGDEGEMADALKAQIQ